MYESFLRKHYFLTGPKESQKASVTKMVMNCTTRMSVLGPPLTTVFGAMFIVTSIAAAAGNGFVLFVIWRPGYNIASSTKILTSLAVSDLLVGIVSSPLTCWQVINYISLKVCDIDIIRRYFLFFLCVTSGLTLALISCDRYIHLTKLTNYNKYMTKRKLVALLLLAWLVPALIPVFQLRIFGRYVYLLGLLFCFFGILIVLSFSYCCIFRLIRRKEKKLKNYDIPLAVVDSDKNKKFREYYKKSNDNGSDIDCNDKGRSRQRALGERKYVALGKSAAVLIICFLLCNSPFSLWSILVLLNARYNFLEMKAIQILYVISTWAAQFNSCVNPLIYFLKNPEFRRRAKSLF